MLNDSAFFRPLRLLLEMQAALPDEIGESGWQRD
jgi:hypothetical protein